MQVPFIYHHNYVLHNNYCHTIHMHRHVFTKIIVQYNSNYYCMHLWGVLVADFIL